MRRYQELSEREIRDIHMRLSLICQIPGTGKISLACETTQPTLRKFCMPTDEMLLSSSMQFKADITKL